MAVVIITKILESHLQVTVSWDVYKSRLLTLWPYQHDRISSLLPENLLKNDSIVFVGYICVPISEIRLIIGVRRA